MKNHIFLIFFITIVGQSRCAGHIVKDTDKGKAISQALAMRQRCTTIYKNVFDNTATPVDKNSIIKYLLVKHVVGNGMSRFLFPTIDSDEGQGIANTFKTHYSPSIHDGKLLRGGIDKSVPAIGLVDVNNNDFQIDYMS